jgi:hypothetical protein
MPHILKNKNITITLDHPTENYNFSRFDWTGKITALNFQGIQLEGQERSDTPHPDSSGKGFYNEFGIDTALGFEAAEIGDWFHKIGVGLLKKENAKYHCATNYEIKPANFQITTTANKVSIRCKSETTNGYSYLLKKEIELQENGFVIKYYLENTGEKEIITDEYVHNFTKIGADFIGLDYSLKFPFQLKPALFLETVNPEKKVMLGDRDIKLTGTPTKPFFFSNLTGDEKAPAQWELTHFKSKIGIRETGNFETDKVNLWGTKHVISPELFIKIKIKPTESVTWTRKYDLFKTT